MTASRWTWMRLALFAVVALAQLGVPIAAIVRHERTLRTGHAYKLRTAPVDPEDAFRGKYVALSFEAERADLSSLTAPFSPGQTVYARLAVNPDGFASISQLTADEPEDGDFMKVKIRYNRTIEFPFDRYYMDEVRAPAAEIAYREASNRVARNAHVTVRIRDGYAALEDLFIDDVPVRELLDRVKP